MVGQGQQYVLGSGFGNLQLVGTEGVAMVNQDDHTLGLWLQAPHILLPVDRLCTTILQKLYNLSVLY